MPVYHVRAALNSAIFPFYTQQAGRTIIVPEFDENWDRNNAANTTPDKGVPQVYYMENVLPIAGGFQSVGYDLVVKPFRQIHPPPGTPAATNFDQAFILLSTDGSKVIFVPAQGSNYVYDAEIGTWASISPINSLSVNSNTIVTTATINGQTYFCYANYGTYIYNTSTKLMVKQTLISLTDAAVIGITVSNGYMIAWTKNTVAWSSLVNPLDFTPSIQTGAGGGAIQQAKGNINFCLPINGGFIMYCEKNTVAASYSNNVNYPFVIKEIADSGGCYDPTQVAWQENLDTHYAMTTAGLQGINLSSASPVMPEVDDFLAAQIYEEFDANTNTLTQSYLQSQLYVKLTGVGDRFIIISYGIIKGSYQYCIVFDLVLGRYGKLAFDHVGTFEFFTPNLYNGVTWQKLINNGIKIRQLFTTSYEDLINGSASPEAQQKQTFALLTNTGGVYTVDFALDNINSQGVFILGKYQFKRNSYIVHQRTDVESINPAAVFSFQLLPSLDGKTLLPAVDTVLLNTAGTLTNTYAKRFTGLNISFLIKGSFELTSLVTQFTLGGFR